MSVKKNVPLVLEEREFFARVLDAYPRTVVFDCDGTLWSRDAGSAFLTWSMEQGMVSRETTDWILGRYSQYRIGTVDEVEICGDMVRMYAGLRIGELRAAASRFYSQNIAPHIFPDMLELTKRLSEQGAELWAVSSTNSWVIDEGVRDFGIPPERVLAARTMVRDGFATDTLVAVPSGEAKRAALRQAGVRPNAVFGNSIHDAAMLAMTPAPYAVNPSPALAELAALEGWPVYWPRGARTGSVETIPRQP
jgi:phosphoserine phosphatase